MSGGWGRCQESDTVLTELGEPGGMEERDSDLRVCFLAWELGTFFLETPVAEQGLPDSRGAVRAGI